MDSFISIHKNWVPKVLGPGGDVSTSEGKCNLGAAQAGSLEVQTNPGNRWEIEPLELNGLEANHAVHTICVFFFGSTKELCLI